MAFDLLNTLIVAVGTIVAAGTAIHGIDSWRKEMIYRRRAELAEEALSLFYEAESAFKHIRGELSHTGEYQEHPWSVVVYRIENYSELFANLQAIRYRARALFGADAEEVFMRLKCVKNKIASLDRDIRRLSSHPDLVNQQAEKLKEELHGTGCPDEIGDEIKRIVSVAESLFGPSIR